MDWSLTYLTTEYAREKMIESYQLEEKEEMEEKENELARKMAKADVSGCDGCGKGDR
jgi:ferredoxin